MSMVRSNNIQFISEFLIESIDILDKVANRNQPPLSYAALEDISIELIDAADEESAKKVAIEKLSEMAKAFEGRGNSRSWDEDILKSIDKCFIKNYYDTTDSPCDSLFFPNNPDNQNRFTSYCSDVDKILQENAMRVPPFSRTYFAYAMMWKVHGHPFPIPMGTATVIEALHHLASKYHRGLCEVSLPLMSLPDKIRPRRPEYIHV